jgi:hypothetical protein
MEAFTAQQWKAASAHHECQAKRITVEAQHNSTAAQCALQAETELREVNTDLVAKAARCALVINENHNDKQTSTAIENATGVGNCN